LNFIKQKTCKMLKKQKERKQRKETKLGWDNLFWHIVQIKLEYNIPCQRIQQDLGYILVFLKKINC
jgi:hypothetical protein